MNLKPFFGVTLFGTLNPSLKKARRELSAFNSLRALISGAFQTKIFSDRFLRDYQSVKLVSWIPVCGMRGCPP